MRNINLSTWVLALFTIIFLCNSCKKETDDPFDAEAKKAYEAIIALQDSSSIVLAGFEATMDSTAAVEALALWFRGHEYVAWARIGSQGISVSYTNGMFGGIMLDPERLDTDQVGNYKQSNEPADTLLPSKNLPSYKKARCINAAMDEFYNIDAYQFNTWKEMLNSIGYECVYNLNDEVSLDYLKHIRSRNDGIISLNSHGYVWPDRTNIQEVYFLTGEESSLHTTKQFYTDLIEQRVIMIKHKNDKIRYYIAPDFLTKYNDFSKDTILFYGGFCYSFLGNWTSLVNACASGTYFGFDWAVKSDKCAEWAVNLVYYLADMSVDQPNTTEGWMVNSMIAKHYFSEKYNRNIHILYEGNGAFTLWQPEYNIEGGIEALAQDKAPIMVPGKTCFEYTLKCNVSGQLPQQFYYLWDLDHETAYAMGQNGNEVVGRWGLPGTYTVKAQIRNQANSEVIREFAVEVTIEDPSYLDNVKAYPYFKMVFSNLSGLNITLTNEETMAGYYYNFDTFYFTSPLNWNDSTFSAQSLHPNGNGGTTLTIQGEMSADGKVIRHCLLTYTEISSNGVLYIESKLEVANLPVFHHDEWNCWQSFIWDIEGTPTQNYVQSVEFKKLDTQNQGWITIQSIDWGNSQLYGSFKND
ncbi:MAG: hypothetical protein IH597_02620 [Bacteroidales bacterium]|nr:hypothetical protein [Bacteroidales bacterium]